MKNESVIQMIKFTLFSSSAGIIQALSFTLLFELLNWVYWSSYLTALILSIVWNFTLNRKYTFKSNVNVPVAMLKLFGFYLAFTPLSTYLGHVSDCAGVNEYIILALTMLSNLILEFLFSKFIIYKKSEQ